MKFGLAYNTGYHGADPDQLVAIARHAEACGFESFYVPEHIALYPGAAVGPIAIDPTLPIVDPLDSLAFVAAATERIWLGTAVLLVPYHHPVILAKRLATIDQLSKGRLRLFTVGLGTLSGEAAALGVDFASRGRRADEAIDVLRLLWSGDGAGVSHAGEFFAFTDLTSYPKPSQASTLPIHVGGSSRAAARRAGRCGDGYFPGGALPPQERAAQLEVMRAAAVDAGRDPSALDYTRWGSLEMTVEGVEARRRQGITRLVVATAPTGLDEQRAELTAFAERMGLRG